MGICEHERSGRPWWHEGLRAEDAAVLSQLNWAQVPDCVQTSSSARSDIARGTRQSTPSRWCIAEDNSPDTQSRRSTRRRRGVVFFQIKHYQDWTRNIPVYILTERLELTHFTTRFLSFSITFESHFILSSTIEIEEFFTHSVLQVATELYVQPLVHSPWMQPEKRVQAEYITHFLIIKATLIGFYLLSQGHRTIKNCVFNIQSSLLTKTETFMNSGLLPLTNESIVLNRDCKSDL